MTKSNSHRHNPTTNKSNTTSSTPNLSTVSFSAGATARVQTKELSQGGAPRRRTRASSHLSISRARKAKAQKACFLCTHARTVWFVPHGRSRRSSKNDVALPVKTQSASATSSSFCFFSHEITVQQLSRAFDARCHMAVESLV